jgi:ubiquinone/menaquinone biosynthesis C-methylase UbiE
MSAGERELKLLGNVKGKDVLEVGCGGGQNAIVLAKWGAGFVGVNISEEQIKHARKLTRNEGVKVPFHLGDMEDLGEFKAESFDIVLSSFAIEYAHDFEKAFQEVFRVLRETGLFVFAMVHPIIGRGGLCVVEIEEFGRLATILIEGNVSGSGGSRTAWPSFAVGK